ncbi:MAG: peptidase M3 [Calditrichaeota bacterium]|nr:peptidase M3 [Calditrichota bacterium]MCB9475108.1 peptidase M3 [Candidatus Delongbacteria bacterium]
MSLLNDLNRDYLELHESKENAFWSSMMGLTGADQQEFNRREIALKHFISDASWISRLRDELERPDLTADEREGLEGWKRFFEVNAIEDEGARRLQAEIIELEGRLDSARRTMALGYTDPATGRFERASSVKLGLMLATHKDEAVRRAAWQGLGSIEPFVLQNGFLEIVTQRNRLGRLLGYEDYYDMKVSRNEGFSKKRLFELLDELERDTRDAARRSVDAVVQTNGEAARDPWNFGWFTSGDLTARKDPYLPFAGSFSNWVKSFAALGIRYSGANLTLDLVDRSGKYENGFMHGPGPAWVDRGTFRPARINFTANAVPGQVGSGHRALQTFFHEGGHAAHFSNIRKPAPCFAQEFAPTSVAFAETQSMFLDSLISDPDWLRRYAKNAAGEAMPEELILEGLRLSHTLRAYVLRTMLAVSYFEKALYELPEAELKPERVLAIARDAEQRLSFLNASARPLLSIPHLLAGDSSAYYHGYTLAQMAVYQTRAFFLQRDGHLMDNPAIGPDLARAYWAPGNSRTFLQLVQDLTGEPFSAKATVALVNQPLEEVESNARRAFERERKQPHFAGDLDLDAEISVIHGDQRITSSADRSLEQVGQEFGQWIQSLA